MRAELLTNQKTFTTTRRPTRSLAAWWADHEIWPMAAGVALATLFPSVAHWGLGLLALTWLVRWLGRGRLAVRTPADGPMLALFATVPLAFWITPDRTATSVHLCRLLAGMALAYGLVNWVRPSWYSAESVASHLSLLALGLVALGLLLALYGLVAMSATTRIYADLKSIVGETLARYGPIDVNRSAVVVPGLPGERLRQALARVKGTVNPNMMAGVLVALLPGPLALALAPGALPSLVNAIPWGVVRLLDQPWLQRLWVLLAALAMVVTLSLTRSRGAWIAAGAAIVVVLARRWALLAFPAAGIGVAGALRRLGGPEAFFEALGENVYRQWAQRVEVWSRAIDAIRDFPLTGAGPGAFAQVVGARYPLFLWPAKTGAPHAHNLLLQVAFDLGLPGLIAFLALLGLAVWCALDAAHRYRQRGQSALAALSWGCLAGLVAMGVHGAVDATTWIVGRGAFVLWAVIGTILALHRQAREEQNGPAGGQTSYSAHS